MPLLLLLAAPALFEYNSGASLDVRTVSTDMRVNVQIRDITFANASGGRTAAYLVSPEKPGHSAGVLFVHWYEPESKDSNRTQFLEQAVELASSGTVSLLIATMWSQPDWFAKRTRSDDFANSVKQVKELRRALDVLLATPGVDRRCIAYVGHDFGAMYGAVLAGVDRRVKAWALQSGNYLFQ